MYEKTTIKHVINFTDLWLICLVTLNIHVPINYNLHVLIKQLENECILG